MSIAGVGSPAGYVSVTHLADTHAPTAEGSPRGTSPPTEPLVATTDVITRCPALGRVSARPIPCARFWLAARQQAPSLSFGLTPSSRFGHGGHRPEAPAIRWQHLSRARSRSTASLPRAAVSRSRPQPVWCRNCPRSLSTSGSINQASAFIPVPVAANHRLGYVSAGQLPLPTGTIGGYYWGGCRSKDYCCACVDCATQWELEHEGTLRSVCGLQSVG
jgi:hypothetical protein